MNLIMVENCLEQVEHNGWCLPEKVGFLVTHTKDSTLLHLHTYEGAKTAA